MKDDAISRQDAIALLEEAESARLRGDILLFYPVMLNGLKKLPSAQQWIPVSERLPKKVDNYLVTTHSGQIARYIYMGNGSSKDYWMRCVAAWMPLPDPYRPEGDRDNVHKPD